MKNIQIVLYDPDLVDLPQSCNIIVSVQGFKLAGHARSLCELEKLLRCHSVQLVIAEPFGEEERFEEILDFLYSVRPEFDILVVSKQNDGKFIARAFRSGVFDYIVKPFKCERYRESLIRFRCYYSLLESAPPQWPQSIADRIKRVRVSSQFSNQGLPKGLHQKTLDLVRSVLRESLSFASASEIAEKAGLARSTVWRYLEYLCRMGEAVSVNQYRSQGRPTRCYRSIH